MIMKGDACTPYSSRTLEFPISSGLPWAVPCCPAPLLRPPPLQQPGDWMCYGARPKNEHLSRAVSLRFLSRCAAKYNLSTCD